MYPPQGCPISTSSGAPLLPACRHATGRRQMRPPRPASPNQNYRLGALKIAVVGQLPDARRPNLGRDGEVKLLQRLHPRKLRIPDAIGHRAAVPFLALHAQQRFQAADVAMIFLTLHGHWVPLRWSRCDAEIVKPGTPRHQQHCTTNVNFGRKNSGKTCDVLGIYPESLYTSSVAPYSHECLAGQPTGSPGAQL